MVEPQRQRGRRHPSPGGEARHPVPDPRRPQRAVRHVADRQLAGELTVQLDHIWQHPALARLRPQPGTHRRPRCNRMPRFPTHAGRGLPRLQVGLIGHPDTAPLRAIAQPHRAQPHDAGRHPQRARGKRPPRMQRTGTPQVHDDMPGVDQPRWARNATSTISPVRICSASLGTTTRQFASANVASRCDGAPGAPPSA